MLRFLNSTCVTLAAAPFLGGCLSSEPGENNSVLMAQSDWRIVGFSEAYESHYPRDIQSSIAGSLAAGATHDEIIRGVGRVAARYGIGDWEARPESFVAIGRAYKLAGKSERKLAALADKLAGGEDEKRKLMLSSYREQAISTRTQ